MAQGDAYACQKLADAEGLGDVVVGAGVEGVDLGRALAAAGQDDDRDRGPACLLYTSDAADE